MFSLARMHASARSVAAAGPVLRYLSTLPEHMPIIFPSMSPTMPEESSLVRWHVRLPCFANTPKGRV